MNHTTRTISIWPRARRRDHTLRRTLMRVEDLLDVYHRVHLTLEDENTAGTDPTVMITFIATAATPSKPAWNRPSHSPPSATTSDSKPATCTSPKR